MENQQLIIFIPYGLPGLSHIIGRSRTDFLKVYARL